jgi:hypothetical protein
MSLTKPELLKLKKIEHLFDLIRQHKDTAAIGELVGIVKDAKAMGYAEGYKAAKEELTKLLRKKAENHWDKNIANES